MVGQSTGGNTRATRHEVASIRCAAWLSIKTPFLLPSLRLWLRFAALLLAVVIIGLAILTFRPRMVRERGASRQSPVFCFLCRGGYRVTTSGDNEMSWRRFTLAFVGYGNGGNGIWWATLRNPTYIDCPGCQARRAFRRSRIDLSNRSLKLS